MGKTIFRKIAGKIVPIRIGSQKAAGELQSYGSRRMREITAKVEGKRVGGLLMKTYDHAKHASVVDVKVEAGFKGHGIARELFKHASDMAARIGRKFIRTDSAIIHPAQVKIRMSQNSRFVAAGMGKYGEQSKVVSAKEALKYARKDSKINVRASTMIGKRKK